MKITNEKLEYMTGYFGRPSTDKQTGKWTKVHVVKNGKPICYYKPHKTMLFQWNSYGINYSYIECKKCRNTVNRKKI